MPHRAIALLKVMLGSVDHMVETDANTMSATMGSDPLTKSPTVLAAAKKSDGGAKVHDAPNDLVRDRALYIAGVALASASKPNIDRHKHEHAHNKHALGGAR